MDARIVRLYRQDDSPQVWAWVAVDSPDFFSRYGKGWDDVETVKIKPRLIRFAEEKAVYLGTYIDDFKQAAPYGLNPGEVEVVIDNMKYASGLAEAHTDKELAKKEAQEWRSNTEKLADSFEKLLQEAEEMKVRESAMEAELEERRKLVAELREDLRRYQTVPLPEDPSAGELFIRFIRKIFGL